MNKLEIPQEYMKLNRFEAKKTFDLQSGGVHYKEDSGEKVMNGPNSGH